MQKGWSYIKDTGDFICKKQNVVPYLIMLFFVTADVVRLYPSISNEEGLGTLRKALGKQDKNSISTEDLIKMVGFLLKSNFLQFNSKIKQVSGTASVAKLTPPYACLLADKFETIFVETQQWQLLLWFRYMNEFFFIWTHSEEECNIFFFFFSKFDSGIKFTHESNKENIAFLDVKVSFRNRTVFMFLLTHTTLKNQLSSA